jgi:creatinine amidohydrolase
MRFEECRPHQLDAILRDCPLAVIPWGAHEWHGPQNPVGLDTLKVHAMALDLCRELGGVVLPHVYCGFNTIKLQYGFRHTLEFSRETVFSLALQYLEQLYEAGFRVLVILMGHYGGSHVQALEEAVARFTATHSMARAVAWTDFAPASWVGVDGADHAAGNETSLMMHYRPDLVDLGQLPAEGDINISVHGIWGNDPRESTPEHGAMLAEVFVQEAAPKLRALLDEVRDAEAASRGRVGAYPFIPERDA